MDGLWNGVEHWATYPMIHCLDSLVSIFYINAVSNE